MLRRTFVAISAALLTTVGLSACGSSSASDDPDSISVVVTGAAWSAELAPFAVAEAQGYFEEEGITVTMSLAKSGTETAQQVLSGNAEIGVATPEPVMISTSKGTPLQYVAPFYGKFIYSINALNSSGITSIADLKGKRIGITNANSTGATITKVALKEAGLSESDVTLVPIGVGAQQITSIQQGQVDALAMWDTQYAMQRNQGIESTPLPIEGINGLFGGGFFAAPATLKDKKSAVEKYLRALNKAFVFSKTNPEAAIKIIQEAHPEVGPQGGQDADNVLADNVSVLNERLSGLNIQEGQTSFFTIDPVSVDAFAQFALDSALVTELLPASDVLDTSFAGPAGNYDYATVATEAQSAE